MKLFHSIIFFLILSCSFSAFSQTVGWTIENGKATAKKTILITPKTSDAIYIDIQRWLVKQFPDPEENLKARIDGEYIRGVGYHSEFHGPESFKSTGLKYTYIFEIDDQHVTFAITDVSLYKESLQDIEAGTYAIEDFMTHATSRKKHSNASEMLTELTQFSNGLFRSFELCILRE